MPKLSRCEIDRKRRAARREPFDTSPLGACGTLPRGEPMVTCVVCGTAHDDANACPAALEAAQAGAHPAGVPLRIYGGYLEARAALRGNAPAVATRVLQW